MVLTSQFSQIMIKKKKKITYFFRFICVCVFFFSYNQFFFGAKFYTFAKSENNLQQAQRVNFFSPITSPKKVGKKDLNHCL
jgi:hypothetical protein